jgi:hypothetical protein
MQMTIKNARLKLIKFSFEVKLAQEQKSVYCDRPCVHIIRVRCSNSLSNVRNFSLLTAMTAPLKNLSPLMKNLTFFARFSLETWIKEVLV